LPAFAFTKGIASEKNLKVIRHPRAVDLTEESLQVASFLKAREEDNGVKESCAPLFLTSYFHWILHQGGKGKKIVFLD
jgi:hypothetical protein